MADSSPEAPWFISFYLLISFDRLAYQIKFLVRQFKLFKINSKLLNQNTN